MESTASTVWPQGDKCVGEVTSGQGQVRGDDDLDLNLDLKERSRKPWKLQWFVQANWWGL